MNQDVCYWIKEKYDESVHGEDVENFVAQEHELSARTDRGARIQAKQVAKIQGIKDYWLCFYRQSDGCEGHIDK